MPSLSKVATLAQSKEQLAKAKLRSPSGDKQDRR